MQFEEYNGWPNFPTWDVFTVMTSYYETYQELERVANSVSLSHAGRAVEQFVKQLVEAWKKGEYTGHEEAVHIQVQDFLMNGVRRVNWTLVYDTLRGERGALGKADELTEVAYNLLQLVDWQAIVADAEYLTQADDMLREWLQDQCITWVESPDARMYQSQIAVFANSVLEMYFGVVKWKQVASALRGE